MSDHLTMISHGLILLVTAVIYLRTSQINVKHVKMQLQLKEMSGKQETLITRQDEIHKMVKNGSYTDK